MPDDIAGSRRVSLQLTSDLIADFDRLAKALSRPRSWVMERALCCWLDDEGAEILEDSESLAELDRGEFVSPEDLHQRLREIIDRAEKSHSPPK